MWKRMKDKHERNDIRNSLRYDHIKRPGHIFTTAKALHNHLKVSSSMSLTRNCAQISSYTSFRPQCIPIGT